MIKFSDINPDAFDLPTLGYRTKENSSDAIDNIVDNIVFYIESNKSIFGEDKTHADKDENELLAIYMDEYFETHRGSMDADVLTDISSKLGRKFLDAYEILRDKLHPQVTFLNDHINKVLDTKMALYEGYKDPEKIKFDYVDLSSFYNMSSLAISLCNKYKYDVNILNMANIGSLYKKLLDPKNVLVTNDTIKGIMGEITITIKNDNDDVEPNVDVNTDTEIPTDVSVNGEDKSDGVSGSDGGDDPDHSDSGSDNKESDEGLEDTNVDVNTPDENDNVSVVINGQKVNNTEEVPNIPDKEYDLDKEEKSMLYKLIVEACFSQDKFRALCNKFANMNASNNKPLKNALWFSKFPISKMYKLKTPLSDVNREIMESNLESIEDLQKLVAVNIDLATRNNRDMLIISPRILNTVKVDEAKNRGIDVATWVRDYLRLYHNSNEHDSIYNSTYHANMTSGVTLEKLIVTRPVVESTLMKHKEAAKSKDKTVYMEKLKETFINTLNDYVDKVIKFAPNEVPAKYGNPRNFRLAASESIKSIVNKFTNSNYSNIEDSLYSFHFLFWYTDTLVERIYKDTSYQLQLELHNAGTESFDNATETNIRAKVMSGITVSFLKELF